MAPSQCFVHSDPWVLSLLQSFNLSDNDSRGCWSQGSMRPHFPVGTTYLNNALGKKAVFLCVSMYAGTLMPWHMYRARHPILRHSLSCCFSFVDVCQASWHWQLPGSPTSFPLISLSLGSKPSFSCGGWGPELKSHACKAELYHLSHLSSPSFTI